MEDSKGGHTTRYSSETTFIEDEGLIAVPVSGKTDRTEQCLLVRFSSPTEQMVVTWEAARRGGPPKIPHPLTFIDNHNVVLISKSIGALIPVPLGNDMGHEWLVGGVYTYQLRAPRAIDAAIPSGKMPFELITAGENTIPSNYFDKTILSTDALGTAPPLQQIIVKT